MALNVNLGQKVNFVIDGHSAVDGANMPAGSTLEVTSNDATVATPDTPTQTLSADTMEVIVGITVLAAGSTDIHAKLTTSDGSVFEATDTLVVATPVPGLTHISATLVAV